MKPTDYNKLIREFLKYLESLSPDAISSLVQGDRKISFSLSGDSPPKTKPTVLDDASLSKLQQQLRDSKSREDAHSLIAGLTKASLTVLAKRLDTPTQKADTIDRLREKIVEATIGFKMRSEAIQTTNAEQGGAGQPPTRPESK
jgi:hypothetical protein